MSATEPLSKKTQNRLAEDRSCKPVEVNGAQQNIGRAIHQIDPAHSLYIYLITTLSAGLLSYPAGTIEVSRDFCIQQARELTLPVGLPFAGSGAGWVRLR